MFTQQNLLDRGWTKGMIEKYLGNPDRTIPNRHYRKALERKGMLFKGWQERHRIKLYEEQRVLEAEERPLVALKVQMRLAKKHSSPQQKELLNQIQRACEMLTKMSGGN